jgi:hypothetical protein
MFAAIEPGSRLDSDAALFQDRNLCQVRLPVVVMCTDVKEPNWKPDIIACP